MDRREDAIGLKALRDADSSEARGSLGMTATAGRSGPQPLSRANDVLLSDIAPGLGTQQPADLPGALLETVDDPRIPAGKEFFKIGEVTAILGVKAHVVRYWEQEFPWVRPAKTGSNHRRYRRQDLALLLRIQRLRHEQENSIQTTRDILKREHGRASKRRPRSKSPKTEAQLSFSIQHSSQEVMGSLEAARRLAFELIEITKE